MVPSLRRSPESLLETKKRLDSREETFCWVTEAINDVEFASDRHVSHRCHVAVKGLHLP